ncbi:hypothetical protein DDZ18_09340 [Marinicauda salina]|uniref:Nucleoside-diphosphate sugar epimerase n=1 Tax=Marinicauda salina TaxID=2135793 RepID=A0A2U2BSE3_9PROT|nr:mitochondrial fission ELM1 family protein [Marinicauda salina]PWE16908.1 hypothetical protein DDZ18_09340 [Marinicauda salina]
MTSPAASDERVCFVVSDGRRGIENQALGLAEALGRLTPLRIMPVHVPRTGPLPEAAGIAPDVWIGCGRAAVRASAAHRKAYPRAAFIYVQDPRSAHERFDLIVAPRHDRLKGDNVVSIIGSPNRITPERLREGAGAFRDRTAALPEPRAAVLIGGDSKRHRFTREVGDYLMERLEDLREADVSLMVTTSRRTPPDFTARVRERFAGDERVWLHDGEGPNPYFAFLEAADWILVTEDSTNMLTEAAATGTPVYRLPLAGRAGKFKTLYEELEAAGAARPFLGRLDAWDYDPLHETGNAARRVLEILD